MNSFVRMISSLYLSEIDEIGRKEFIVGEQCHFVRNLIVKCIN